MSRGGRNAILQQKADFVAPYYLLEGELITSSIELYGINIPHGTGLKQIKTQGRGGLSHFPPTFKNIFVVFITFPHFLLCK